MRRVGNRRAQLVGILPVVTLAVAGVVACNDPEDNVGPSLASDAGSDAAVDVPDSRVPDDPWWEEVKAPPCPESCTAATLSPELVPVFEAPDGVELREAVGSGVFGFDTVASQHVRYSADVAFATGVISFTETRYPQDVTRILIGEGTEVVLCRGEQCTQADNPLPDDLHPRATGDGCIVGNGIYCGDASADATYFPAALVSVARRDFGQGWLVVDERGGMHVGFAGAVTDADGFEHPIPGVHVRPMNVAAPLARVVGATNYRNDFGWVGVTTTGDAVLGWKNASTVCPGLAIERLSSAPTGAVGIHDGHLRVLSGGSCSDLALPSGAIGAGIVACGIATSYFAFDAHTVYAPAKIFCALD